MTSRITTWIIISMLSACAFPGTRLTAENRVINNAELTEISGMAASTIHSDQYWIINDSGHPSAIYLINKNAETLKKVIVTARNRDWEDLASYVVDGISWLMIADSGDNRRRHNSSYLHFFREQTLLEANNNEIPPDFTVEYSYSNGPQNCEAVAVDPLSRKVLFLSKSSKNAAFYELNLPTNTPTVNPIAKRTVKLQPFPDRTSGYMVKAITGFNPDFITGMDIKPDGTGAVVLTYRDVWEFSKSQKQTWKDVFESSARHLSPIRLKQAEAISVSRNSNVLFVTSEGQPSPLMQLTLPQ